MFEEFPATRFNPSYVRKEAIGTISIREKQESGQGTIAFAVTKDIVAVRNPSDQPPLAWTKHGKCADGAIIIESIDGLHAHLVELKGSVGPGAWEKIKKQFHGMFLNVVAVSAVAQIPAPTSVTCHIAFKKDGFRTSAITDPTLIKTVTGGTTQIGGGDDWKRGSFKLDDFGSVELRKIQRNLADGSGIGVI